MTTARNRAIDRIRRDRTLAADPLSRCRTRMRTPDGRRSRTSASELVFTCCHPALSLDAQVALTLNARSAA